LEARTAVRGSGISKSFVAVCAVVATMGLGVTAGVVAKNLSAPVGVPAHILQGQGGALQYSGHRGGVQAIDETLTPAYQQVDTRGVTAAPAAVGPDDRVTTSHLAPSATLQIDNRGIIPAEAFLPAASSQTSFLGPDAQDRNAFLAGSAASSFLGPDAQERNANLAAAMRTAKPHGYI
jgi:hypothetical protein